MWKKWSVTMMDALPSGPVSVDLYTSDEVFRKQKDTIFRRCWLFAGIDTHIANVGDFFVKQIPTLGFSLLFVRGDDGKVRGFYNACTHRGNAVCLENNGNVKRFSCPFHNWTFGLTGRLLAVPGMESFADFRKTDYSLIEIKTGVWNNLIFFTLSDDPAESLDEFLAPLESALSNIPFGDWTSNYHMSTEIKSNWMMILDGARESYHVFALHRLSGAAANSDPQHLGTLLAARNLGCHGMVSYWGNPQYRPSPLESLAISANPKGKAIAGGRGSSFRTPSGLNPSGSPEWSLDTFAIFPNLLLQTNGAMMVTQQTWPMSAGRAHYEFAGHYPPAATAAERFTQEHSMAQTRDILNEDIGTYERTHANFASGAIREVIFSDNEVLLRQQHHAVSDWLERSVA